MRAAIIAVLLCTIAFGQAPAEPAESKVDPQIEVAIRGVSEALGRNADAAKPLFTTAGQPDLSKLIPYFGHAEAPLSEQAGPWLIARSSRQLTPEFTEVEAVIGQYGSLVLAKPVPVLLLLKKNGEGWLVDSARVLVP